MRLPAVVIKREVFLLLLSAGILGAQATEVIGERMRPHVKFLASDLLEGRGVGTRGGDLAVEYIASQLAIAGAKPAGENGTYFQKLTLVGVSPSPNSSLTFTAGGKTTSLKWADEFVGVSFQQKPAVEFDANAVFVGHGIVAPEYQWDDYKDIDVRGKVVVLFTGEPPSNDPKFFTGAALTYYGRWSYKYEEAARKGAIGAIIIHTTPTASYGWNVVRSSWSTEDLENRLAPGEAALGFAGWVTTEAAAPLSAAFGKSVDEMLKMADTRGFKAQPLSLNVHVKTESKIRTIETRNVAARVEGSDPKLKDETVIFSAHWDHLGIGEAVRGDTIYNGAVDNATGCAMLIELARAWASLPQKPRRSLFIAWTGEERGLLGSDYWARHPTVAKEGIVADVNIDALRFTGPARNVVVVGGGKSELDAWLDRALKTQNRVAMPEPTPEKGFYYRSDHFSLAKQGVPMLYIENGDDLVAGGKAAGAAKAADYEKTRYHGPKDEYDPDWDWSGMMQDLAIYYDVGRALATSNAWPNWLPGDEFRAIRDRSRVGSAK